MPIQLYALTWSTEERKLIEEWQIANSEQVAVVGWSRILLEPLNKAVQDPNIFGLAIEGVVVRDHSTWPPDTLKEAVKKLSAGMLDLYSVANGLEPITLQNSAQY